MPDLQPASRFETWVGDVCYRLTTSDPFLSLAFAKELVSFTTAPPGATELHASSATIGSRYAEPLTIDLDVRATDLSMLQFSESDDQYFDSGGLWRVRQFDNDSEFIFNSPVYGHAPYKLARIHRDFRRGQIHLHQGYLQSDTPVYPLEYPLDELLLVHLLAHHKAGIELHGCGLVTDQGRGALFLGQSGAGKTTTANLWSRTVPSVKILSDDRIIVRPVQGAMWMFGTPWHGEGAYSLAHQTNLSGIFFLKQSTENHIRPLPKSEAIAQLFACSFAPLYLRTSLEASIDFLGSLVQAVPCFELSFLNDPSTVHFVAHAMELE